MSYFVGFWMYYIKPHKIWSNSFWVIFWQNKNFKLFLIWTALNCKGRSKTKIWARDICKRTLHIEFEWDWWISLDPKLGEGKKKLKNIFKVSRNFQGKADSITLLGFKCTIKPQNLIKIVLATFEEIKIFFLMWTIF